MNDGRPLMADTDGLTPDGSGTDGELQVVFGAPSNGWIQLQLTSGTLNLIEPFSHIYPSLRDLCSALCDVLNGVPARTVTFLLEPAELELILTDAPQRLLRMTVREYPDRRRTRRATVVFEHHGASLSVVLTFWRALRRLESLLPDDRFEQSFRASFPRSEMAALSRLVAATKARGAGRA